MRYVITVVLALTASRSGAQSAPRSFEATAESETSIRCAWLASAGASGYLLQRDGKQVARLDAATTEYSDNGLVADSTHRYAIRAIKGGATSAVRIYVERTFASFPRGTARDPARFDIVVAQASSGGVAAAIEAGRRGLRVALIEPTSRPGGMPVNGLCATDLRRPEHASGFFVRFRDAVKAIYAAEGETATGLQYEPRVALQAMKSLLYAAPNITLLRRARLAGVRAAVDPVSGRRRVVSIDVEKLDAGGEPTAERCTLSAKYYIDATDCGDLAAWAGAAFRTGREARSKREPHAGYIFYDRANDRLLPGSTGKADKRIMSYAYLLVVKDYGPGADHTIPRPPGYRREDFTHSPPWNQSWAATSGRMPGSKYELNQHPEGNDLQEINYRYPTAGYADRARVEQRYRNHVLGYLYYIQTELGRKQLGLPDDEFRDSGGFPQLLYLREGRRIIGEELPDESAIVGARDFTRPESVGLGDYPMDSHAVEPKTDWARPDMGEGEYWLYRITPWHELPVGILIPRGFDNLLVTTAVSSTHVSYGTYRLEPVRMAFGQTAGILAALGIRYGLSARSVPARLVQDALLPHPANPYSNEDCTLSFFSDLTPASRHFRAIDYLAARGFRFADDRFAPAAPTTRAELAKMLALLADRAAPAPRITYGGPAGGAQEIIRADYAYMGAPADAAAVDELTQWARTDAPITRAEFAHWLVRVLPAMKNGASTASHYSDMRSPDQTLDANALYAWHIDSELWESWNAIGPDGRLLFRPDAPLRHDDLFAALYIAQIGLGPLFNDNPIDGKNGRKVPAALMQTVPARAVDGSSKGVSLRARR